MRVRARRPHHNLIEDAAAFSESHKYRLSTEKEAAHISERLSVSKRIYALGQGVFAEVAVCRLRQASRNVTD